MSFILPVLPILISSSYLGGAFLLFFVLSLVVSLLRILR